MADTPIPVGAGNVAAGSATPSLVIGDPYFNYVGLLLHMDGANASTTFTDIKGKTVTANGNAQISTAQSKFGGSSGLFDGTGDFLSIPSSTDFAVGAGNFTIELWLRLTTTGAAKIIFQRATGTGNYPYQLWYNGTQAAFRGINDAAALFYNLVGTTTLVAGTWYHLAGVRTGSTFKLFVNGVEEATATPGANVLEAGAHPIAIGAYDTGANSLDGHLDDVRFTKGVARYTAAFTPPTLAFPDAQASLTTIPGTGAINVTGRAEPILRKGGDPYFEKTVLLLHMDGDNASTVFRDEFGNTVTANGNAQISTAQSKFGGAAALFDGVGDYLSIPNTLTYPTTLSENFTVECWVYVTANPGATARIAGLCDASGGNNTWSLILGTTGDISFQVYDSAFRTATATSLPLSSWAHIAGVKNGSEIAVYINGVKGGTTATLTGALVTPLSPLGIGRMGNYDSQYFTGRVDDFRITKGVARYISNFTVTDEPFPNYGKDPNFSSVVLGLHMDGTNGSTTFTDIKGKTVTAGGNAQISTAQSKFGGASALFDGTGDFLSVPSSTDFDLDTVYTIECWVRPASVSINSGIVSRGQYVSATTSWTGLSFSIRQLSAGIRFYFYGTTNANEQFIDAASSLALNTWTHIAMVRNGTSGQVFINGVSAGTISSLNTPASSARDLSVGRWEFSLGDEHFNGHIEELRITKGIARYTSNFALTPSAFPDEGIDTAFPTPSGAINFTGAVPVIEVDSNTKAFPGVGGVVVTGQLPQNFVPTNVFPGSGVLTFTGYNSVVNVGVSVGVGGGSASIVGTVPSILIDRLAAPNTNAINITSYAPLSITPTIKLPGAGEVTIAGTVSIVPVEAKPNVGSLNIQGLTPVALRGVIRNPGVVNIAISGQVPTSLAQPTLGYLTFTYTPEATASNEFLVNFSNLVGTDIEMSCPYSSYVSSEKIISAGMSDQVSKEIVIEASLSFVGVEFEVKSDANSAVGREIEFSNEIILGVSRELEVAFYVLSGVSKEFEIKSDLQSFGTVGAQYDAHFIMSDSVLILIHAPPVIVLP